MAISTISKKVQVKGTPKLALRSRASTSGQLLASIPRGTQLDATKSIVNSDGSIWYEVTYNGTTGWCHTKYLDILVDNKKSTAEEADESDVTNNEKITIDVSEFMLDSASSSQSLLTSSEENAKNLLISNLGGVFGIPYQFMASADRKVKVDGTSSLYGRTYVDKIIAKIPLLLMSPGRPNYMSDFNITDQTNVLGALISGTNGSEIDDIIKGNGRYYTFQYQYDDYFEYVNGMARSGAKYLGIGDLYVDIGGEKNRLDRFNWQKAVGTAQQQVLFTQEAIPFYVDSTSSVDEDFSNSTVESQLSSKVNSISDIGREITFLLGAGAGMESDLIYKDEVAFNEVMASIDEISNKYLGGNQLLKDIGNNFATVAIGGKLLFPEIWADSEYSKSYNINMKLRTPDGDAVSWYLNIYVALCHLIAFTAPLQLSPNGYKSPFLVRAYYKGLFNCDMGIVSSLSISKGKDGSWSVDGLPTEVDVSLTIKDLYQMMMLTKPSNTGYFLNNSSLMNYIANTCGVNLNKLDGARDLSHWLMLTQNKFLDVPTNLGLRLQNWMSNLYVKN